VRTGKVPAMDGKRAALSLLLTVIVGCGGATPTTSGAGAGASAATTTASSAPSGASTASAAASAAASGQKLSDLLAASKTATYKITYKISASGAGAEGFSGEQTWYFKPPRARFDFSLSQSGQALTIQYFTLPEGSFYCINIGQLRCMAAQGVGSPIDQNPAALAQRSLLDDPSSFGATLTGTKTIAGQTGQCYDVKASATTAAGFTAGTFCYTKDGVPLLSQFSAAGSTFSVEATNYSTTVADSDFTLPAKP
jgi:hypothetical protein